MCWELLGHMPLPHVLDSFGSDNSQLFDFYRNKNMAGAAVVAAAAETARVEGGFS